MKTVSVRIPEEEKRQLMKYGRLSDTLRESMKLYLSQKKTEKLLCKLKILQNENPVKTSNLTEAKLIRKDRNR